jgi:hypothetical protein
MKRYKLSVALLIAFIFGSSCKAQVAVQTWIDPCTNTVQTATFPLSNIGVTVMYRGVSRVFTAAQAQNGELLAWIQQVTVSVPCPIANNPVVTQTAAQTATQAAAQAASAAASAAASGAAGSAASSAASSAATSAASSTPTPAAPAAPASSSSSSNTPSEPSSSSSSSESSSNSTSESSGESSEGGSDEKKEEKKSSNNVNPILVASDITTGQNPDGTYTALFTIGASRSSLAGDKSYGATAIVWTTLDQFALSGNYSKMHFEKGKLTGIGSYSGTVAYLQGTTMTMVGYTYVKPDVKWGVYGVSGGVIGLFMPEGKVSIATSLVGFWMHPPITINERATLSPQIFILSSPVGYNEITKLNTNTSASMMVGNSLDYKLTRRFGATAAHRVMLVPSQTPLHFILIGSRMTL